MDQINKELQKQEISSKYVKKAQDIVRTQMKRGNDFVAICSISKIPYSLQETGSFVLRDKFIILKPRRYEATLFLFENMLFFTTEHPVSIVQNYIELNIIVCI